MRPVHWCDALSAKPPSARVVCDGTEAGIQFLLADGSAGVRLDGLQFALGIADVTCADCKALIEKQLKGEIG